MSRCSDRRLRGFTLVEVLVALTLFSLLMTAVFGGLYTAGRSWSAGETQVEHNEDQRLELAFIVTKISAAIPLSLYDARRNRILFTGERDSLRFVTNLPSHRGGEWTYLVTIRLQEAEENGSLVLDYEPIRSVADVDAAGGRDTPVMTLLDGIRHIEFSYFGSEQEQLPPDWQERWDVEDRLPQLVRLRIEPRDPGRYLPELVVPVRMQAVRGQPQQILYATDADRVQG